MLSGIWESHWAERRMLEMMCGVQLTDRVSKKELSGRFGQQEKTIKIVRQGSLKSYFASMGLY